MNKRIISILLALVLAISATGCTFGATDAGSKTESAIAGDQAESADSESESTDDESENNASETDVETDSDSESGSSKSDSSNDSENVSTKGDFTITTEDGAFTENGSVFTVTSAGTYTLTGVLSNGQVVVNAGDEDEVVLQLNGCSITCASDSPILASNADKVKIVAVAGTKSSITDSRALQTNENDTTGKAAIYAQCDLSLSGTGSLIVSASYNNGVHTNDDLKVKETVLTVTAPNNALKGNDSVTIESGVLTLTSTGGDGIKTDNSDVSSKGNQRGTVTIEGGTITITSADDGVSASYDAVISAGTLTVKANGKGVTADNSVTVSGGTISVTSNDDALHANNDNALENGASPLGNVTITGGSITVNTGDDGIHADGTLLVTGGYVNVAQSHEGLEGHYVTIENGEIHVYANDDGVNATSSGSFGSDGLITVSGGSLYVEVAGRDTDGIDSNGSYKQTGGFVVVSNPNADGSGNVASLDVDSTVSVTGGILIALGGGSQMGGMRGEVTTDSEVVSVSTLTAMGPGGRPGQGGQGGNGGFGGFGGLGQFGIGGMFSSNSLPDGAISLTGTLAAGTHSFTYNGTTYEFTLKQAVSGGFIWASGITSSNYTLK